MSARKSQRPCDRLAHTAARLRARRRSRIWVSAGYGWLLYRREYAMIVGLSVFELHIPHAGSLKHKRKVVKGLVERIHQRCKVSVIESDHQDLHQRAEIAIALVARSEGEAQRLFDSIRNLIDLQEEAVVIHWQPDFLAVD